MEKIVFEDSLIKFVKTVLGEYQIIQKVDNFKMEVRAGLGSLVAQIDRNPQNAYGTDIDPENSNKQILYVRKMGI